MSDASTCQSPRVRPEVRCPAKLGEEDRGIRPRTSALGGPGEPDRLDRLIVLSRLRLAGGVRSPARRCGEPLSWAPKLPLGWILQLYRRDALGLQDDELRQKVGARLYARCRDVLLASDARLACPRCGVVFDVPWIGQPSARISICPSCGWSISAGTFHASFEHRDLLGINARSSFADFVSNYPLARNYGERMLLVDRLVHAVHASGNPAARNLIEGRPRAVIAALNALAAPR